MAERNLLDRAERLRRRSNRVALLTLAVLALATATAHPRFASTPRNVDVIRTQSLAPSPDGPPATGPATGAATGEEADSQTAAPVTPSAEPDPAPAPLRRAGDPGTRPLSEALRRGEAAEVRAERVARPAPAIEPESGAAAETGAEDRAVERRRARREAARAAGEWPPRARIAGDVGTRLHFMDPELSPRAFDLSGEVARRRFEITLPAELRRPDYTLYVSYINGIDVLPDASRVTVRVNGEAVARLPADAFSGMRTVAIDIPAARLPAGRNRISFEAAHTHRVACRIEDTYELWTWLDPRGTFLAVRSDGPLAAPTLDTLDLALASTLLGREPVSVLLPEGDLSRDHLNWGADVAQGTALRQGRAAPMLEARRVPRYPRGARAQGRELNFPGIDQTRLYGARNILVGTAEELSPYLGSRLFARVEGPYLGVYPLDANPERFILVISGTSESEVDSAAAMFRDRTLRPGDIEGQRWISNPATRPPESERDPVEPGGGPGRTVIRPDSVHSLAALGYETTHYRGLRHVARVPVHLPPDFFITDDSKVIVELRAGYDGARLGEDAFLNVFVNGEVVSGLELDAPGPELLDGYPLRLPLRAFRPGRNELVFEAKLPVPEGETGCQAPPLATGSRDARFSLFDDSEIQMPAYPRLGRLPDLAVTASTAFPYSYRGDPEEQFHFNTETRSLDGMAATWTLLGRLAQSAGRSLNAIGYFSNPPVEERNLLRVGVARDLEDSDFDNAAVGLGELTDLWYEGGGYVVSADPDRREAGAVATERLLESLEPTRQAAGGRGETQAEREAREAAARQRDPEAAREIWRRRQEEAERQARAERARAEEGPLDRLGQGIANMFRREEPEQRAPTGPLLSHPDWTAMGVILQNQSPRAFGKTWTTLTAPEAPVLLAAARRLADQPAWSRMAGAVTAFGPEPGQIATEAAADHYNIHTHEFTARNLRLITSNWFSRNIVEWTLFIVILLGVLGVTTYFLGARIGNVAEE